MKKEDKYEVIIPERIYIVFGLEEVRRVMDEYKVKGVSVRLLK